MDIEPIVREAQLGGKVSGLLLRLLDKVDDLERRVMALETRYDDRGDSVRDDQDIWQCPDCSGWGFVDGKDPDTAETIGRVCDLCTGTGFVTPDDSGSWRPAGHVRYSDPDRRGGGHTPPDDLAKWMMPLLYQYTEYGQSVVADAITAEIERRESGVRAEIARLRYAVSVYANPANWRHGEGCWIWLLPGEGADLARFAIGDDHSGTTKGRV